MRSIAANAHASLLATCGLTQYPALRMQMQKQSPHRNTWEHVPQLGYGSEEGSAAHLAGALLAVALLLGPAELAGGVS
jgi:hypothetical protein